MFKTKIISKNTCIETFYEIYFGLYCGTVLLEPFH